jgi:hypothetical protein
MKKSWVEQLLPAFVLIAGVLMSSACGGGGCSSGTGQLPAGWVGLRFPLLDGAKVCAYSEEVVSVEHEGVGFPDAIVKYMEALKSGGWEVGELSRPAMAFDAQKGEARFSLQFFECNKYLARPGTWSTCTRASIRRFK